MRAVVHICVLILLAAGFGLLAPSAMAQANLLVNGDFAAGSTAGWTCSSGDTVVASPVYPGSSYALAGTPTSSDDAQCSQVVSVQPNATYTLAGWVQGDYVFLGDSGTGGTDTDAWTPAASSWTELSASFTTGSATTSVTVYVHGWYAQPAYYADDLSLTGPAGSGGGGGGGTQPRPRRRTWPSPGPRRHRSPCPGPRRPGRSPATTPTRTAARPRTSPPPARPSRAWPPRPRIRSRSSPTTPRASPRRPARSAPPQRVRAAEAGAGAAACPRTC